MVNNVFIGALNCAQYVNLLSTTAIRVDCKIYLCKSTQLNAHGLFYGNQKSELQDPNFVPLSFREITLYTLCYKQELCQNVPQGMAAQRFLRQLIEGKENSLTQKNLLMRIIEHSLDCFHNLLTGFGFTSTLSLAEKLRLDLDLSMRQAAPTPTATAATTPAISPAGPQRQNRQASAPSRQHLTPPPISPAGSPLAQTADRSPRTRQRVRERTQQTNEAIRESYRPEISVLDGRATNPNPRAAARARYLNNTASRRDLFTIFQDINSIEIRARPLESLIGVMLELSGLPAVDLNNRVCQNVIVDAFKVVTETTCDHIINWLKFQHFPAPLVNECLQSFVDRHANHTPLSLYAIIELLLYAHNHHIQIGAAGHQILQTIHSMNPNFHRLEQVRALYQAN